jgi:hypothetical protein
MIDFRIAGDWGAIQTLAVRRVPDQSSPSVFRRRWTGIGPGELPYLSSAERLATGRDFSAVVSCESTARHPRGLPEAAAFPKRDT